jgi:hypothetical protein
MLLAPLDLLTRIIHTPPRIMMRGIAKMRSLTSWTVMMALLGLTAGVARADSVYVAGSGNEFGKLDLGTGALTPIGTLALPAGDILVDLAPYGAGSLLGIDAAGEAFRIDAATARLTDVGSLGIANLLGLGGASGHVFGIGFNPEVLYSIDLGGPAPSATSFEHVPIAGTGLVAVGPDGSVFVTGAPENVSGSEFLFRIDPVTGAVTTLGPTGMGLISAPGAGTFYAGAFVGSTLYGFDGATGDEYTLDTATGAATLVGTPMLPNGDFVDGIAAAPVPEPASLTMLGIGIAGIAAVGLRRRRGG